MEILCVSNRADREEPEGWAMRFILLRLLLYPEEGSQVAGTTGASEFNLFLSHTYAASADAKLGLKPKGPEYS